MGPTGESGTLLYIHAYGPQLIQTFPKEILNYMAVITRVCLIPWCLLKNNVANCLSIILEALLMAQYNCRTDKSYTFPECVLQISVPAH